MDAIEADRDSASSVPSILSYLVLLAGLATIAFSAYLVVASYSSLPYWDGWTQISHAANTGNPSTLAWLWKQHNEHRMPIPKLFLLADLYWFRARQVFLLASIFVIQLLQLLLLAWSIRALGGWRGTLWRTGVGLLAFCVFCPSQWMSFLQGFQISSLVPGGYVGSVWESIPVNIYAILPDRPSTACLIATVSDPLHSAQ